MVTGITTVYAMIPIFINMHIELLTRLNQSLGIFHCLHKMNIIIGGSMNQSFTRRNGEVAA